MLRFKIWDSLVTEFLTELPDNCWINLEGIVMWNDVPSTHYELVAYSGFVINRKTEEGANEKTPLYEGDILNCPWEENLVVNYSASCGAWFLGTELLFTAGLFLVPGELNSDYKKLGNIKIDKDIILNQYMGEKDAEENN